MMGKRANNNYFLLLNKYFSKTMVVMVISLNKIKVGVTSLRISNKEDGVINHKIKAGTKIKDLDKILIKAGEINLKIRDGINLKIRDGDKNLNRIKVDGVTNNKTIKKTGVVAVDGDKNLLFFILNL